MRRFLSRSLTGLRGRSGRQLVKLTAYAGVCLVVLALLASRLGNIDFFAERTGYAASMADVTGLLVNDEVKIAGVGVGKVTGISVERGEAVVRFEVDDEVRLPADTQVGVRWRNVLGQKYLYLHPGESEEALQPGDRLPVERSVDAADVGAFLHAIGPVLRAIDPAKANAFVQALNDALDENEAQVRALLDDAGTIATELGGADEEIGSLIVGLDAVVGGLAERDADLQAVVERFGTLAGGLAENNADLQLLVERFAEVQEGLDQLLAQNRDDLDATIVSLVTIAEVLGEHREDLDRSLASLPDGLAIYDKISSYGQWFQIRAKITCLANQRQCTDEAISSELVSSGVAVGDVGSVVGFALAGGGS